MERRTVSVYEEHAREWTARRSPKRLPDALRFAAAVDADPVRGDLGCGSGFYTAALGPRVVALDAAMSMLELARSRSPRAWFVQGDLEALPLRDGSLGGAWANDSYLHVPRARLPMALARLHWATTVGAPLYLAMRHGDAEGCRPSDDFPGRYVTEWRPGPLRDVVTGAGLSIIEERVEGDRLMVWARRARTLPDTVEPGMRLLVCGLNPSVYAADAGVGFARPGNRFWPAATSSGVVTRHRDPLDALRRHGMGMTDVVKRATSSARELARDEYRTGAARVERLVRWLQPGAVCFVGLTGWRAAIDPLAQAGEQPGGFGGVPAYVMPSTSGANAHARLADLTDHLRAAAALADARRAHSPGSASGSGTNS